MKLGIILGTFLLGLALVSTTTPVSAAYNFNVKVTNKTKKNPSSAVAHNKLGLAYSNTGKYHKAIAEYRKALKINPTLALVYNNLGSAYHATGLVNQAISEYKKCLELMPNSYKTLNNLGISLITINEYEAAFEFMLKFKEGTIKQKVSS